MRNLPKGRTVLVGLRIPQGRHRKVQEVVLQGVVCRPRLPVLRYRIRWHSSDVRGEEEEVPGGLQIPRDVDRWLPQTTQWQILKALCVLLNREEEAVLQICWTANLRLSAYMRCVLCFLILLISF